MKALKRTILTVVVLVTIRTTANAQFNWGGGYGGYGGQYSDIGQGAAGVGVGVRQILQGVAEVKRVDNEKEMVELGRDAQRQNERRDSQYYSVTVMENAQVRGKIQHLEEENRRLRQENVELKKELAEIKDELKELKQILQKLLEQKTK